MKYCQNCGNSASDHDTHCAICGTAFDNPYPGATITEDNSLLHSPESATTSTKRTAPPPQSPPITVIHQTIQTSPQKSKDTKTGCVGWFWRLFIAYIILIIIALITNSLLSTTVSNTAKTLSDLTEHSSHQTQRTTSNNTTTSDNTTIIEGEVSSKVADSTNKTSQETTSGQQRSTFNPSEDFVIKKLQTIESVTDIDAVTEDNDPNGKLGKEGGYTSTVYFLSSLVNQSEVYGETIIEKGTNGGGAIEIYPNIEDAHKRNEYLSGFDGLGPFDSGSHKVVGTVVIRTSKYLTKNQQEELELSIIEVLTSLD